MSTFFTPASLDVPYKKRRKSLKGQFKRCFWTFDRYTRLSAASKLRAKLFSNFLIYIYTYIICASIGAFLFFSVGALIGAVNKQPGIMLFQCELTVNL